MSLWNKLSKLTLNEPSKYAFKISLKNEPLIMPLKSILCRGWVARATAKMWPNDPQSVVRIYPTMLFTGCTSYQ